MKANKDDCTYVKEQHQVYLFVQLGLGKFSKITKISTKPILRPALRQLVVQQTIQTAAYIHRVYCVVQLGQTPFCQTKMIQILVACYRDRITI
jgi:hypothetical protein